MINIVYIQRLLLFCAIVLHSAMHDAEQFFPQSSMPSMDISTLATDRFSDDDSGYAEQFFPQSSMPSMDISDAIVQEIITESLGRDAWVHFSAPNPMPASSFDPIVPQDTFVPFDPWEFWGLPSVLHKDTSDSYEDSSIASSVTHSPKRTKPQNSKTQDKISRQKRNEPQYQLRKKKKTFLKLLIKQPEVLSYIKGALKQAQQKSEKFSFDHMDTPTKHTVLSYLAQTDVTLNDVQSATQHILEQITPDNAIDPIDAAVAKEEQQSLSHKDSCKRWRENQTEAEKRAEVAKRRVIRQSRRAEETEKEREDRLQKEREYIKASRERETPEEKTVRLAKKSITRKNNISNETGKEREGRLQKEREYIKKSRERETPEQYARRRKKANDARKVSRARAKQAAKEKAREELSAAEVETRKKKWISDWHIALKTAEEKASQKKSMRELCSSGLNTKNETYKWSNAL